MWSWRWKTRPGRLCVSRLVAVVRGDTQDADVGCGARQKLGAARQVGWRKIVEEHEAAWADRWRSSDIEVEGDPAAEQALRFAVYHLNSATNPADERVSIGARGLTGDDYQGHVFWDTEIYLLPFYSFTWPEAARALLMYRFRPRRRAAKGGPDGMARRHVRLGVGGYWCGGDAGAGRLSGRPDRRHPFGRRNSTLPQTSRMRSGSTGRQLRMWTSSSTRGPKFCSRRAGSGRAVLSRRRRLLPHPRCYRTG